MPNIGPMEIAIVVIVALLIFGPSRLPELGKSAGNGLREFKDSVRGRGEEEIPSIARDSADADTGANAEAHPRS